MNDNNHVVAVMLSLFFIFSLIMFLSMISILLHDHFAKILIPPPQTLQLLDLKDRLDNKESVYGALDAWVAWEQSFPIASLKNVIIALEKEEEWHKVVQVWVVVFLSYCSCGC